MQIWIGGCIEALGVGLEVWSVMRHCDVHCSVEYATGALR